MSDLYASIEMRRRLTEADLLTGAEALAVMVRDGMPEFHRSRGYEPAGEVLARLCADVAPTDFLGGAAPLWRCAVALWSAGKMLPLEAALGQVDDDERALAQSALAFARQYGMGVGYQSPVAAARLLALTACTEVLRETQQIAARTVQEAREAFDGVV